MTNPKLLIVSTSTVHGKPYLSYITKTVSEFFEGCKNIAFVPYARPSGISHDTYTAKAKEVFEALGFQLKGVHEWEHPKDAAQWADGFFTGGGNTFVLTNMLYQTGLMEEIREAVKAGKPYMGTSAGSNITGLSINTTNDMPIVYPPSFEALGLVPFNINPHYLDPDPNSKHMGETRETRINEFHAFNQQAVVGLREGSSLRIEGNKIELLGELPARIFQKDQKPLEVEPGESLEFLMTP